MRSGRYVCDGRESFPGGCQGFRLQAAVGPVGIPKRLRHPAIQPTKQPAKPAPTRIKDPRDGRRKIADHQ